MVYRKTFCQKQNDKHIFLSQNPFRWFVAIWMWMEIDEKPIRHTGTKNWPVYAKCRLDRKLYSYRNVNCYYGNSSRTIQIASIFPQPSIYWFIVRTRGLSLLSIRFFFSFISVWQICIQVNSFVDDPIQIANSLEERANYYEFTFFAFSICNEIMLQMKMFLLSVRSALCIPGNTMTLDCPLWNVRISILVSVCFLFYCYYSTFETQLRLFICR